MIFLDPSGSATLGTPQLEKMMIDGAIVINFFCPIGRTRSFLAYARHLPYDPWWKQSSLVNETSTTFRLLLCLANWSDGCPTGPAGPLKKGPAGLNECVHQAVGTAPSSKEQYGR